MGYTSRILLGFVALLIGVLLLSQIATESNGTVSKGGVVNDSTTFVINGAGTSVNTTREYTLGTLGETSVDCPITNFVLAASNATTEWTDVTDYVVDLDAGTFTLKNTSATWAEVLTSNVTLADYNYCDAGYMQLGWGRTMLNLTPGFFALALLLVAVALFYGIYRDTFGKVD